MLKPVERKNLSDQVFSQLRDGILNQTYTPGDRLPSERELCDMLKINRSSVREALKRLEQARLIEIKHGHGSVVLDFKYTASFDMLSHIAMQPGEINYISVRSIIEIRTVLCGESARLAAMRIQKSERDSIQCIVEKIETCPSDDFKLFQILDWDFHYALAHASENIALILIYNSVKEIYFSMPEFFISMFKDAIKSPHLYRKILQALEINDPEKAKAYCVELIETGNKQFMMVYESMLPKE
ncbi:MAG: FadR family transcriptional regulator [Proteobacteria bacterium]|nr:FadR family transcriptional regulator [Pseudomonadota bacterium]